MKKSNLITAVSQGILDLYRESGLLGTAKVKVVYSLLSDKGDRQSVGKFLPKDKKVVLYAGKLSRGKGVPQILLTAKQIVTLRNDILFLLVGKTPAKEILNKAGDNDNIKIISSLERNQLLALYRQAYVVISPSICPDALPRSLLDGLLFGKPLIGTKVGGIPEIIQDKINGILIDKFDVEGLKNAILKIIDDPKLTARLSYGNKRISKKFASQKIVRDLVIIYNIPIIR